MLWFVAPFCLVWFLEELASVLSPHLLGFLAVRFLLLFCSSTSPITLYIGAITFKVPINPICFEFASGTRNTSIAIPCTTA